MSYAVVQDIAASWASYPRFRPDNGPGGAPGLILHAARPTDEGFRTIEVWDSEAAWQQFREHRLNELVVTLPTSPLVRSLHVRDLIYGSFPPQ